MAAVEEGSLLRYWRTWCTIALLVVMALPLFALGDGVPLSSYPMYASPRSDTTQFVVPVGVDRAGREVALSTPVIAGSNDPLVAESYLRETLARRGAGYLCARIAERSTNPDVRQIEIRSERHRVVARVLGESSVVDRTILASCPVL